MNNNQLKYLIQRAFLNILKFHGITALIFVAVYDVLWDIFVGQWIKNLHHREYIKKRKRKVVGIAYDKIEKMRKFNDITHAFNQLYSAKKSIKTQVSLTRK